jgi:hypothetical protein
VEGTDAAAAEIARIMRDQDRQLQALKRDIADVAAAIDRAVLSRKPLPRRSCVQRRRGAGRPAARACSSGRSDPDLADLPRPLEGVQS